MTEEQNAIVHTLKTAILASLRHSVMSKSDRERHSYCPDGKDSWCRFKRKGHLVNKSHHLDPVFLPLLIPIYRRLSDVNLLRKCLGGYTQNQN